MLNSEQLLEIGIRSEHFRITDAQKHEHLVNKELIMNKTFLKISKLLRNAILIFIL